MPYDRDDANGRFLMWRERAALWASLIVSVVAVGSCVGWAFLAQL